MRDGLYETILSYQAGDKECAWDVIQQFNPLLKKYAYFLGCEDGYEELSVQLLSMLKKINLSSFTSKNDAVLISYIQKTVHNAYIQLSKKKNKYQRLVLWDDLNPFDAAYCELNNSRVDSYERVILQDLKKILNRNEYTVISLLYLEGLSVAEIAKRAKKTRQAINQTKNNALKKLRKKWLG